MGIQGGDVGFAFEWPMTGQALVDEAGQGVLVRTGVDRLALDLLRGDVRDGAQERGRAGYARLGQDPLGQAEVAKVCVLTSTGAAGRKQHVAGLDVAMDESRFMGRIKGTRHLGHDPGRARRFQLALARDHAGQVHPVHEAHGDVQHAIGLARVVQGDDVGVVERAGGPRLAQEALAELGFARDLGGDDLEGRLAAKADVLSAIDDPHAAAADDLLEEIARDFATDVGLFFHRRPF